VQFVGGTKHVCIYTMHERTTLQDGTCKVSLEYACADSLAQAVSSVHERGFAVMTNFLCRDEVQCLRQVSRAPSEEDAPLAMSLTTRHESHAVCDYVYIKMSPSFPGMCVSPDS
jgi:hypothetical protein